MTCLWTWIGDQWSGSGACPEGQSCPRPDGSGPYIGYQTTTNCEGPS